MLLLIHSIKLLHTHQGNNSFSHHNCNGNCFEKNDSSDLAKSSSDCSICNYQVTKDADDLVYHAFCNFDDEQINFNSRLISFQKYSFHTAFENRGPPEIML
jgi:hypothetical protein